MEINKFTDILGVVVTEDITEGRLVALTANTVNADSDLPGVRLPVDADDAKKAFYVVTWIAPNQSLPLYIPSPSIDFSLRRGAFDQAANLPLTGSTIHLTWPGQKEGVTIPSGFQALAFSEGVFTVPSGAFVYSASLVPGAYLEVLNVSDDTTSAGKLNYTTTQADAIAIVERYDSVENKLTFRTLTF